MESILELFSVFRAPADRVEDCRREQEAEDAAKTGRNEFRAILAEHDTRPKSETLDDVRDRLDAEDELIRRAVGGQR